jgi:hypothetical protein
MYRKSDQIEALSNSWVTTVTDIANTQRFKTASDELEFIV